MPWDCRGARDLAAKGRSSLGRSRWPDAKITVTCAMCDLRSEQKGERREQRRERREKREESREQRGEGGEACQRIGPKEGRGKTAERSPLICGLRPCSVGV